MRRVKSKSRSSVRHCEVVAIDDSRRLQTVTSTDAVWSSKSFTEPVVQDALVRVMPPHDVSDAKIFWVKQSLLAAGACKVKVLQRAASPKVVGTDTESRESTDGLDSTTIRSTIAWMVDNAFVEDRDGLRRLVEHFLEGAEGGKPKQRRFTAVEVGHLTGIRLHNWLCFHGEFELALQPKLYSITAQDEDDLDRSNWLGKSSFLRAIVFAMTGKYPTKTADGWISHAESSGGVDLQFSSGLFVSRWKERGKGTRLEVSIDEDADPMTGADAQRFLEEAVIDHETMFRTSYLEQKAASRFITMGGTALSETVNGWLEIGWIEDAAELCMLELNKLCAKEARYTAELAAIEDEYGKELPKQIRAQKRVVNKHHRAMLVQKQCVSEAGDMRVAVSEWRRAKGKADLFEVRRRELVDLDVKAGASSSSESWKEGVDRLEEELHGLVADKRVAYDELQVALKVRRGQFDGNCPVAGIACPAVEKINTQAVLAHNRFVDAQARYEKMAAIVKACREKLEDAKEIHRKKVERERRHEAVARELEQLRDDHEFIAANPVEPPGPPDTLQDDYEAALQSHSDAVSKAKALEGALSKETTSQEALGALRPRIELHRAALMILGRNGAQRFIAEGALQQIERDGNRAITEAGIDLAFRVSWAQETKKPADACDKCGAPFPASARVKLCSRCGADRGKKFSHSLKLELSNSSGGADDLGGVAFQLSAANWLRRYQECTWAIFLIDEPFGALDRANVRGLSRQLDVLLTEQFGAAQSFIVAHHADVLESAPGRIHITASAGKSRIEVLT